VTASYDQFLAPAGLRTTQFSILAKLKRRGPMTINALAADMVMATQHTTSQVFPDRWTQTASASRIKFVTASGCEIIARWLAWISIIFAPIRLAMKRSRSGFIVRSWADTA
jgi:hypothetical protein